MEEDILKKRGEKIKNKIFNWFKNPYNLALFVILIFAFAIRLYYFILTKSQPLWWDEAEYMLKAKSIFFNTPLTGFADIRETVIPYVWSIFYLLGGEIFVRFFQVIISLFTVFMTYVVGKQLFDKKIGIISALFMSVLSIPLFFTSRLLTYLWTPLIYLVAISLFLVWIKDKNRNKYLYILSAFLAISLVAYFNTLFLILFLLIFLIFTEKFRLIKEKNFWIPGLIFIITISPFILYYFFTIGVPLPRFIQFQIVGEKVALGEQLPFSQWFGFIQQFPRFLGNPSYFGLPLLSFFILGIISLLEVILGFDLILKSKSKNLKNKFLLWLWLLIPLVSLTTILIAQNTNVFYDAFVLAIFPALAIVSALGFIYFYNFIKKYNISIAKLIVVILIFFIIISNLYYANIMIKGKVNSYDTLIDAGLWIKQNSYAEDKVLTQAVPAITYYSERESLFIPREEFNLSNLIKNENPKFFVLTAWEAASSPTWVFDYSQRNPEKFIPIIAFPINSPQPNTIIFLINSSAFE